MASRLRQSEYDRRVFINCPFDDKYKPLFDVIIFAVQIAGFTPHCAREISNAAQTRIDKLLALIGSCRLGIHDLSRTQLNKHRLPRFNMPLELGLDLACRHFGSASHRRKSLLVMDTERYRYQKFISDIAGQDITPHENSPRKVVRNVRDWLATHASDIPGGDHIFEGYRKFRLAIPKLCKSEKLKPEELQFGDHTKIIRIWLEETEV